jgi:hypothetical protein
MKIDVENHEEQVLKGAKETIEKYKPVIFIESFFREAIKAVENSPSIPGDHDFGGGYPKVKEILESYGYVLVEDFKCSDNYLFIHKDLTIDKK